MRPLYELLGMKVGCIQSQMPQPERAKQYKCDITYGTANEMGFDFLRDRLLKRRISEGQRDLFGAMLGRAGSGTRGARAGRAEFHARRRGGQHPHRRGPHAADHQRPAQRRRSSARPRPIAGRPRSAPEFEEDEHYDYDHKEKTVELTLAGRRRVREYTKPDAMDRMPLSTIYEHVERAIKVKREMFLDRQYVVRDGEIVIVDEFTGRLGEGRKWRAGIHQAVEAKEDVKITFATSQAARITVQDFFLRYNRLAGMTGTASTSAGELRKIYTCRVIPVPTNRPPIREKLPTLVFGTADDKWQAIIDDILEQHQLGRPVLVGTRSIDKSEILSSLLEAARHRARRAQRPAHRPGSGDRRRTPASRAKSPSPRTWPAAAPTSGSDAGVTELGGLHVICTELHESRRIDRQLIGRCGRQGDPGTYRQFLALDDEILESGFGPKKAAAWKERGQTARRQRPTHRLRRPLLQSPAQSRTPPLPRPQGAPLPRKRTPENAAADGAGPVSGHGGIKWSNYRPPPGSCMIMALLTNSTRTEAARGG